MDLEQLLGDSRLSSVTKQIPHIQTDTEPFCQTVQHVQSIS